MDGKDESAAIEDPPVSLLPVRFEQSVRYPGHDTTKVTLKILPFMSCICTADGGTNG